jgi:hypothetical protein
MESKRMGDGEYFELDDGSIEVPVEGEGGAAPRRSRSRSDGGMTASERIKQIKHQAEMADAHNRTLALQRERVDANWRELNARLSSAQSYLQAGIDEGDERKQAAAQAEIARLAPYREPIRQEWNRLSAQSERQVTRYTPRTEEFLNRHPEYLDANGAVTQQAIGAHHLAVGAGLTPDTDSYEAHIEKTLGTRGGNSVRSSGGGSRSSGNSVALSKSEVAMANSGAIVWNVGNTDSKGNVIRAGDPRVGKPIGNLEFARRREIMKSQGYLDRL